MFIGFACQSDDKKLIIQDSLNYERIFSKIEIVPLETNENSLISTDLNFCEFKIRKDKFYVLDKENSIFSIFNTDGQFISQFDLSGNGPGESNDFTDFIFNKYTKHIEFLSNLGKVSIYDYNLNFIDEIQVPSFCKSFMLVDKYHYVFYRVVSDNRLFIYSINEGKKLKEWYHVEENTPFNSLRSPFIDHNDSVFFDDIYNGKLDLISKTLSSTYWTWDFGKLKLDVKIIPKNKDISYNVKWFRSLKNKAYCFNSKICNNYVYTSYTLNSELVHTLVNRISNENTTFKKINQRKLRVSYLSDSSIFSLIEPIDKNDYLSKEMLNEKNFKILNEVDEFQNPLIIKYYFK